MATWKMKVLIGLGVVVAVPVILIVGVIVYAVMFYEPDEADLARKAEIERRIAQRVEERAKTISELDNFLLDRGFTPSAMTLAAKQAMAAGIRAHEGRCESSTAETRAADAWCLVLACPGQEMKYYEAAAAGDGLIGMSACLVRQMLGEPHRRNSTVAAAGTTEQWVYYDSMYFYFSDDILTAMQIND